MPEIFNIALATDESVLLADRGLRDPPPYFRGSRLSDFWGVHCLPACVRAPRPPRDGFAVGNVLEMARSTAACSC